MESREQVFEEFFTNKWIAEDGLARLEPKEIDQKDPHYNLLGQESPRNDNGILFLAYFIVISWASEMKDHVRAKRNVIGSTIERLVRLPFNGLFNRRAAGNQNPVVYEAHDNYVGISTLSVLYGFSFHHDIISYGGRKAWNYNNVEPEVYRLESQRQPGEIAFYWICASTNPGFLEYASLLIGIIVNMFKRNPGEHMLTWLRLFSLNYVDKHAWWLSLPLLLVSEAWKLVMGFKFGSLHKITEGYFVKEHPIRRMSEKMTGWGF